MSPAVSQTHPTAIDELKDAYCSLSSGDRVVRGLARDLRDTERAYARIARSGGNQRMS